MIVLKNRILQACHKIVQSDWPEGCVSVDFDVQSAADRHGERVQRTGGPARRCWCPATRACARGYRLGRACPEPHAAEQRVEIRNDAALSDVDARPPKIAEHRVVDVVSINDAIVVAADVENARQILVEVVGKLAASTV